MTTVNLSQVSVFAKKCIVSRTLTFVLGMTALIAACFGARVFTNVLFIILYAHLMFRIMYEFKNNIIEGAKYYWQKTKAWHDKENNADSAFQQEYAEKQLKKMETSQKIGYITSVIGTVGMVCFLQDINGEIFWGICSIIGLVYVVYISIFYDLN